MQMTLPGFDDYYTPTEGLQEKATKELIASFMDGRTLTSETMFICKTMMNIARNFDALNTKGRDTSRVMAQLLNWYQELANNSSATSELAPEIAALLDEAKA